MGKRDIITCPIIKFKLIRKAKTNLRIRSPKISTQPTKHPIILFWSKGLKKLKSLKIFEDTSPIGICLPTKTNINNIKKNKDTL